MELLRLDRLLHEGEREAIAFGKERGAQLFIDEIRGRRVASDEGLEVIKTLRLLADAKQLKLVSVVRLIIAQMQSSEYRFDHILIRRFLERIGEGVTRIVLGIEGCLQTFSIQASNKAPTLASDRALG